LSLVEGRLRLREDKDGAIPNRGGCARPALRGASVALALAFTQPAWADDPAPIKIGVIAEGPSGGGGLRSRKRPQIAADEINAKGGVDGRKIEIVSYDNHSSSADFGCARSSAPVNEDHVNCGDRQLHQRSGAGRSKPWAGRLKYRLHHAGRCVPTSSPQNIAKDYEHNKYTFHGYLTSGRAIGPGVRRRQGTCWSTASR